MLDLILLLAPILLVGAVASWPLKMDPETYLKRHPEGKYADLAKAHTERPTLEEGVADIDLERDENDLVIRLTDFYRVSGVPTKSDKDTRKIASSPGMFTWLPDDSELAHVNPENRRTGIKLTAILSTPREEREEESESEDDDRNMSRVSY